LSNTIAFLPVNSICNSLLFGNFLLIFPIRNHGNDNTL
jgi:hypothetical protein